MADESKANNIAKKRGTILISLLSSEGKSYKIKLENVLYVPSFPQCIFPVQAATPKGAKVNFDGDHAVLLSSDGIAFSIEQHGCLYYLYKTNLSSNRSENLQTWHRILGHCNTTDIKKLEIVVDGMKINR